MSNTGRDEEKTAATTKKTTPASRAEPAIITAEMVEKLSMEVFRDRVAPFLDRTAILALMKLKCLQTQFLLDEYFCSEHWTTLRPSVTAAEEQEFQNQQGDDDDDDEEEEEEEYDDSLPSVNAGCHDCVMAMSAPVHRVQ
jgi:hypothetical protein